MTLNISKIICRIIYIWNNIEVVSTVALVEVITFNQIKIIIMKKISVISGGTSGLGLEIAELLVKSGKNVLILGRNREKLTNALSQT